MGTNPRKVPFAYGSDGFAFSNNAAWTQALRRFFFPAKRLWEPAGPGRLRHGGYMTFRGGQNGDGPSWSGGGAPRHRPLEVSVGDRGVEGAIRLFKRLVLRDGILRDLKRRAHYEKPGDRRRRKAREAARRLRKRQVRALARGEQFE